MPTIPNPNRALVAPLMPRLVTVLALAEELVVMSMKNLKKDENVAKLRTLTSEHSAIPMETVVLEGFNLPAAEPMPVTPEGGEDTQAKAARFKTGIRVMGDNLKAVQAALKTYNDNLVDEVEEEAPKAEPPPPEPPPEPPPATEPSPPPTAAEATIPEEGEPGYSWREKAGCVAIFTVFFVAMAFAIVWISDYESPTPPPPKVTVAPTPPAAPTASGALDCSLVFSMTSDMDGNGKDELHAIIPVHGGASTLLIEGWSVVNGKCLDNGSVVTTSAFESLRNGLKSALGSSLPTEGMTNPGKVQTHTVMCNIGSGPTSNCFEG